MPDLRPVRSRLLLALAVLAVVAGACTRSDTDLDRADGGTTTTSTEPTTTEAGDAPTTTLPAPAIEWSSCGSAECATVVVPRDHDEPAGATIELSVTRLPAQGERIGALFVNFGGPGSGAVEQLPSFPFPAEVRERFDVVAMDPRGVGGSTPLACGLDPATLYAVDHTIEDEIDARTLVQVSEQYAQDCESRRGDLLPHVGTRAVARDMDLIRAGMGDERLDFLGFSYGTSIGQVYAELFPDRVRTMILDGLVDPAPSGPDVALQQALGFETALARWAADCPGRSSCRFAGPDAALAAVDEMLARAEDGIASNGGVRALGPGEAAVGLALPLYNVGFWPSLDRALADAIDGDGAGMVGLADQYTRLADFSIYFAVSCLDSSWPDDPDEHLALAEAAGEAAPRFGEAIVNDYLRCAVWPTEPDPIGPIDAAGSPPILVVSTTGDPATPHENAVTVAARLEAGVLVVHEGDGHTIVFQSSDCIDEIALAYLIDEVVPADGVRC